MTVADRLVRRGSFLGDAARTLAVGVVILIGQAVAYSLAETYFSRADFGAYALVRRVNQSAVPVIALGMTLALGRYLPLRAPSGVAGRRRLAATTFGVVALSLAAATAWLTGFPAAAASLVLGGAGQAALSRPLALLLAGMVLHVLVVGYFLGRVWLHAANAAQLINLGVVPLVVVAGWHDSGVGVVLGATGVVIGGVTLAFAGLVVRDLRASPAPAAAPVATVAGTVRVVLRYGVPRIPVFLGMAVIWTLGPILATRLEGLAPAAFLVAAIQILVVAAVPVRPLSLLLLPRMAEWVEAGRRDDIARATTLLASAAAAGSLFVAVQLVVFAPLLVEFWLRFTEPEAHAVARIIVLALPGYAVFEALRHPIDAVAVRPWNTYTTAAGVAAVVVAAPVLDAFGVAPVPAAAWATTLGFWVLGVGTYIVARRVVGVGEWAGYRGSIAAGLVLGAVGWAVAALTGGWGIWARVGVAAAWVLAAGTGFGAIHVRLRAGWVVEIAGRLRRRRVQTPDPPSQALGE